MMEEMEAAHHSDAKEHEPCVIKKKRVPKRECLPKFTERSSRILNDWLYEHRDYPYPSKAEKGILSIQTRLNEHQISVWFTNARRRVLPDLLLMEGKDIKQIKYSRKRYKTSESSSLVDQTPIEIPTMQPLELFTITQAEPQIIPSMLVVSQHPIYIVPAESHDLVIQNVAPAMMAEEDDAPGELPDIYPCHSADELGQSPVSASSPCSVEDANNSSLQILALVATQCIGETEDEEARREAAISALDMLQY
ncbi:homeobox protein PKNOX1-like [Hyla sarda]|uniref:homeobox protein PKNOX1-like n=1 Tax=Hyla sarda TaxID=327740 RepID=UPI0024C2C430|nr:homeobox protein PKNOX1-like [Hyla sarda]